MKLKFFLKSLCFAIVFVICFVIIQEFIRDKWLDTEYNPSAKLKGFYAEEDNTLDVIFIGSSQMYADVSPAVLYRDYGIKTYDFCANEQPIWVSYYYVKEALKHQNPKVIVLDMFTMYGEELEDEGIMHFNLDDLPLSMNKIEAIQAGVSKDLRYSFYFPIAKYHGTWIDYYEAKADGAFYNQKDMNKGYSPFIFKSDLEDAAKEEVVNQKEFTAIPEMSKEWLIKIIELCKNEDVPLLLIKTPNGNAERQKLYNSVSLLAKEYDVPFVNMNTVFDGQAHVNIIQAEKISDYIGEYLITNYDFSNVSKNDPSFDQAVTLFERQKFKCELISAETFEEYLSVLKEGKYDVFMVEKNTSNSSFNTDCIESMNAILNTNCKTNIDSSISYILAFNEDGILYETTDEKQTDETSLSIDGLNVSLISPGSNTDMVSSIKINDLEYSLDEDGLNLIIYDKYLGEFIEMSHFDSINFEITRK